MIEPRTLLMWWATTWAWLPTNRLFEYEFKHINWSYHGRLKKIMLVRSEQLRQYVNVNVHDVNLNALQSKRNPNIYLDYVDYALNDTNNFLVDTRFT